jgi:hypothetical protein
MEISKSLRRPSNWQDFESLCKKLWGEIWAYPETKKNGRSGQNQFGVDVYGIPQNETEYVGIQCKGKDEYTDKQFTEKEIEEEIAKALLFQPKLKKFYLATTAVKDTNIEQFVREKNVEHISKGIFEVHIFCWEDIVDLIDENRQTYNWYVKNVNYKTSKSVKVTFQNNSSDLIITPKFKKIVIYKRQKAILTGGFSTHLDAITRIQRKISPSQAALVSTSFSQTEINHSYSKISLQIHNIGLDPIEEYKLQVVFKGEIIDIDEKNQKYTGVGFLVTSPYFSDVNIDKGLKTVKVIPQKKILVGDDIYFADDFFIKPNPDDYEIDVAWKIISKDFKDEGILKIFVKPEIEKERIEKIVEDPLLVGIEEGAIEDFLETL